MAIAILFLILCVSGGNAYGMKRTYATFNPGKRACGAEIFNAVQNGNLSLVRTLIAQGSSIDSRKKSGVVIDNCGPDRKQRLVLFDSTPLMCAASLGRAEIVRILCENGADATGLVDASKRSAWTIAQDYSHPEIMSVIKNARPRAVSETMLKHTTLPQDIITIIARYDSGIE